MKYQILPTKFKDVDLSSNLNNTVFKEMYASCWKEFLGYIHTTLKLVIPVEDLDSKLTEKSASAIDRTLLLGYLDSHGLYVITLPGYKKEESGKSWHAYYQKATEDCNGTETRVGIGVHTSRNEAEVAAILKCLDIREEELKPF